MPEALHRRLERGADKAARKGRLRDRDAYVYGTMRRILAGEQARKRASS